MNDLFLLSNFEESWKMTDKLHSFAFAQEVVPQNCKILFIKQWLFTLSCCTFANIIT